MRCSAQEFVDAIINVGVRRGADGRGKEGLDGHMFMLASTDCRRFGILLAGALRSKVKSGRGEDDERPSVGTVEEARARLLEAGLPEGFLDYVPNVPRTEQRERAQPTRSITQAVIRAAARHGRDGHGRGGLEGYILMLERADPVVFDMLMGIAQRWQVKHPPRSPKGAPRSMEEALERLRKAGIPEHVINNLHPDHKRYEHEVFEYPDPEIDDVTPQ
jgi:hypothetical protein